MNRRKFLFLGAGVLANGALADAQALRLRLRTGRGGGPAELNKAVLTSADLTPLGAFKIDGASAEYRYSYGLALRYRGGTPRLLTAAFSSGQIQEFDIPADASLTTNNAGPFTEATLARNWGDCVQNAIYDGNGNQGLSAVSSALSTSPILGLYWDPVDDVGYAIGAIASYEASPPVDSRPSLVKFTLDDTAGTGTGISCHAISPRGSTNGGVPASTTNFGNRWMTGATRIPNWFANAYLDGRTLGLGFGHAGLSIVYEGPLSMGPAFFAIDPPATASGDTDRGYIRRSPIPMVFHPFHSDSVSAPYFGRRPAGQVCNTNGELHTPHPWMQASSPYFSVDSHSAAGVWIDGPNKHGLICFPWLDGGDMQGIVQASPAPTATTFTVDDIGDTLVGDTVLASTDGTYLNQKDGTPGDGYVWAYGVVTAITGNQITVGGTKYDAQTGNPDTTNFRAGGEAFAGIKYKGGGPIFSRYMNALYVYNPADLAQVAQGALNMGAVQPSTAELHNFIGRSYPIQQQYSVYGADPTGAAFDAATNRLYVRVKLMTSAGPESLIQVYSVDC